MARRMFSPDIVESDAFLEMPTSSQALYFHLGMYADDDGFVNPKKIMRMMGAGDDDLKVLATKRFVLPFDNGVVVIKHWRINNLIRKDWYRETQYLEQKSQLKIKENGAYTELVNGSLTVRSRRLGKDSIGKVRIGKDINTADSKESDDIGFIIDLFKEVNPSYKKLFPNTSQRKSVQRMLETHGKEKLQKMIVLLPKSNVMDFMPVITTPCQLEDKMGQLATAWQKYKNKEPLIL